MKIYQILLIGCSLFFSTSFSYFHPIKLTTSLIEFNPKTNIVNVECRVFVDDFTFSINDQFTKDFNASQISKEDEKSIEKYFQKYYKIYINDEIYPLTYQSSEALGKSNVLSVKFYKEVPVIKKGDQICIKNTLFFEDFSFLQSNIITVRVPPFITENYFEITSLDKPIPLTL